MLSGKCKFSVIAILILETSFCLYAHGPTTHATISSNAYSAASNIQLNFFQSLHILPGQPFVVGLESRNAQSWIVQGSIREDTEPLPVGIGISIPSVRAIFHFYDPQNNSGLSIARVLGSSGLLSTSPSPVWAIQGTGSGTLGPLALFESQNDFPYASSSATLGARNEFFNGLTLPNATDRNTQFGLMFRSLGQTIHLIQDAAQPQHVRNDPHLDLPALPAIFQNPSVYERYVDARPALQSPAATYSTPVFAQPADFFADGTGAGMAEFTNRNFVSWGTNCTVAFIIGQCNSVGGYPLPVINSTNNKTFVNLVYGGNSTQCHHDWASLFPNLCSSGVVTFFGNDVHDANAGTDTQNDQMTTFSIFDQFLIATNQPPAFTLNHFNYDQQAAFLIPRATAYSAGLLNYFFRGSMVISGGLSSGIQILNSTVNTPNTSEDMNGTFSVYYERNDGTRQPVAGGSASLLISQGQTGAMPAFSIPADAVQPVTFTLVFHGALGTKDHGVAGTQFQVADLTVSKSGNGTGTVTSSPNGINCDSSCSSQTASFVLGSLTLTAVPSANSTFIGWSGGCTGSAPSITISFAVRESCVANFQTVGFTVTVQISGVGSGNVTSVPAGINCGGSGTACSASFPVGTLATLTATPTVRTSFFESWTGCTGFPGFFRFECPVASSTHVVATFFEYQLAISKTCTLVPVNSSLTIIHVEITAQGTGAVGSWVVDDDTNQFQTNCGAWSGPTGPLPIACVRSEGQPMQSTFQFMENQFVAGPPPFLFPVTFGQEVRISRDFGDFFGRFVSASSSCTFP